MMELAIAGTILQLLPEKAIYIESLKLLLVADLHLGKPETFQASGIPISNQVNQQTLNQLHDLCVRLQPEQLIVLGDLFHSKIALLDGVWGQWLQLVMSIDATVTLVVGNHDRQLMEALDTVSAHRCIESLYIGSLCFSHEPYPQVGVLNICGHVHPCVQIKTSLDRLRLPCFYLKKLDNVLILPSFGGFTGGYEMPLGAEATAYVIAEKSVIPF